MSSMLFALYGPTGAGKTTLARALEYDYGFSLVSPGAFLREKHPDDLSSKGGFSACEDQIRAYVLGHLSGSRVVLDGFPRHPEQLSWLISRGLPVTHVFLPVSHGLAHRRVSRRERADAGSFEETYWGQASAMEVMADHLRHHSIPYLVAPPNWVPDRLALSLVQNEEMPAQ